MIKKAGEMLKEAHDLKWISHQKSKLKKKKVVCNYVLLGN